MIAVGDIMLSRVVEQKMIEYGDYKYPFLKIAGIIREADIVFGNLETTMISGRIIKSEEMIFRADPKSIEGLKFAGFNVLNIANNHIMNFGKNGLESTIKVLDENNISYIGAGLNKEDIYSSVKKEIKGTKFAFLGFTYNSDQRKYSDGEIYGVANMEIEKMKECVRKAKLENDIVIVSMHAGTEYKISSSYFQENFARNAIDAGADLIIGHHPHVVQNVEKYKEGYILYSLGNFV
ncbi:MAG: CapA family protein, partial [Candidatus Pacebacteria bacterium]|nr:CapA family protein [Candidatus Paceibacterota bacterium]